MNNELAKPVLPGTAGSDYERYLRTEELLALQKTADGGVPLAGLPMEIVVR